ncbi:hydrophobin-263 [Pluteus cervinus]|uniref:Hydrophobin-263 n=1 Tax=Pluteus cervinus TaxID=181527 RepID=A0ACD3AKK1_9AGAR|nr:hydrophobin-263 [Pluteus cervinus]
MMLSRVASFTLVLPLLAFATVLPRQTGNCNTGSTLCCNSVVASDSVMAVELEGLLNISPTGLTGLVGIACSPLSVLVAGENSCSAQPVCCTGNNFGDLLVLGCTTFNLNL